jgi:uncharacterized membrane-anchored protein
MFHFNIQYITFNFNKNRYIALVIMIIGGILGWYSTILMTNEISDKLPEPDSNQIFAVIIGIILSMLYWLKQCYNIQIRR